MRALHELNGIQPQLLRIRRRRDLKAELFGHGHAILRNPVLDNAAAADAMIAGGSMSADAVGAVFALHSICYGYQG